MVERAFAEQYDGNCASDHCTVGQSSAAAAAALMITSTTLASPVRLIALPFTNWMQLQVKTPKITASSYQREADILQYLNTHRRPRAKPFGRSAVQRVYICFFSRTKDSTGASADIAQNIHSNNFAGNARTYLMKVIDDKALLCSTSNLTSSILRNWQGPSKGWQQLTGLFSSDYVVIRKEYGAMIIKANVT